MKKRVLSLAGSAVGAAWLFLLPVAPSYATGGGSGATCIAPDASTLVDLGSANLFNKGCGAIDGEIGCSVHFGGTDVQKTCTANDGTKFSFSRDEGLEVSASDGSGMGVKFSTVGFKGGDGKCLAVFRDEPTKVSGLTVEPPKKGIERAFACKKEEAAALKTNLPLKNARIGDERSFCEFDEAFVGDEDTGRGVCIRCLSPEDPPPLANDACGEEGCSNVFLAAVFDTDTIDGALAVAECGPSEASARISSVGVEGGGTDFQQCNENVSGPDNGEPRCTADTSVSFSSGFMYDGGGSRACGYVSGSRNCVTR